MKLRVLLPVALVLPFCNPLLAASPAATGGALAALKAIDVRYFVAGGTCAAFSHGITCPIDVVKTKIQSEPEKYTKGMQQAALDIIKTEGPAALLAGLGPTVVGYGVEGAMKFGVYEIMKPVFSSLLNGTSGDSNKGLAFLLASVVAGAVAALLLCPMESTRIKMVTDPTYAQDNLLSALGRMSATEGLGASFGGLWAMLSKQVPYTFGKQVSFDVFAGMLYAFFASMQFGDGSSGAVKWAVSIFAAMGASLVACILSQPGDMILTETYKPRKAQEEPPVVATPPAGDETDVSVASSSSSVTEATATESIVSGDSFSTTSMATNPTSTATNTMEKPAFVTTPAVAASKPVSTAFVDVVTRLYRQGGVPKFFTGTQARIVHVGLIITSQLVVYDLVKQMLGLPATGSH